MKNYDNDIYICKIIHSILHEMVEYFLNNIIQKGPKHHQPATNITRISQQVFSSIVILGRPQANCLPSIFNLKIYYLTQVAIKMHFIENQK